MVLSFDGHEFQWQDGTMLTVQTHQTANITPVVVDKEVTITLKQAKINDLFIVLDASIYRDVETRANRQGFVVPIPSATEHHRLYEKLQGLNCPPFFLLLFI